MKKILIVLAVSLTGAAYGNLLSNPGFESGTNAWVIDGGIPGADVSTNASRSGGAGLYFKGDDALASPAIVRQAVDAAAGSYTFAAWVRRESNYAALAGTLSIEWLDADTNEIQSASLTDFSALPNDGMWHHLHVTGSCASSDLAQVRVRMYGSWDPSASDPRTLQVDDAELYQGAYTGAWFANGSFEYTGPWRGAQWNGSRDLLGWNSGGLLGQDWAGRSGTSGVAFYSYDTNAPDWSVAVSQNVYPGHPTGTYTFALWLNQETNALFSNAALKIEWYDATLTNKVQDDAVTNLDVARDWAWHEYHLEGTATSPAVHEVRAVFLCDWSYQTNIGDGRATKLDDARFITGPYVENPVRTDWAYHGSDGYHPNGEEVPGGGGFGTFLDVDYAAGTSRFFALVDRPTAAVFPEEGFSVGLRAWYTHPTNGQLIESFTAMRPAATVILSAGEFHGLPEGAPQEVGVWRCEWPQPRNTNTGALFTNNIRVSYAPFIVTTNGIIRTATNYLVRLDGMLTNGLGQRISTSELDRAFYYDNYNWTAPAGLTNGAFENPAAVGLSGSGWRWWGVAGRETWAVRTGSYGGVFFNETNGHAGVYQDLATTGGIYSFTIWMHNQPGATPTNTRIRLEWYNEANGLVRSATRDLTGVPPDTKWHRASVTDTCLDPNLHHVRATFASHYGYGTVVNNSSILFDDAEFYAGAFTSRTLFANGGFEQGVDGLFNSYWDASDDALASRDNWAGRTNAWGGSFRGGLTDRAEYEASLSQPLTVPAGRYRFGAWLQREANILVTNIQLRIEWLDATLTNKVQADTVQTVVLTNAWQWYQTVITGSCFSPYLFEVRPAIFAQWRRNLSASDQLAMKVDDCEFALLSAASEDSDHDGIPDWWEMTHFHSLTASGVGSNFDGDVATDAEEFAADTEPTNNVSVLDPFIDSAEGRPRSMQFQVGPPTSPDRVYDVWWSTNLADSAWNPSSLAVPGIDESTAVSLTVTNTGPRRFYRTGVRLP